MKTTFTWRQAWVACCLGIFAALGMFAIPAYAVDTSGFFELDRNALDPDQSSLPEDWQKVLASGYKPSGIGTPTVSEAPFNAVTGWPGLLSDPGRASGNTDTDATIFTGGGSKDVNDVSQWKWTSGSVPDKDDITNAYAIAYQGANNHLLVFFGADRFANNGDSQIGFWFFQQDVRLGANGRFTNGVGGPTANHQNGDLLILADFTQGGSVGTIKVYEWMNGALNVNPVVSGGECVGSSDLVCAMINLQPTQSPWPYTPKAGVAGTFPSGSFFEGGIDITAIFEQLGQSQPCFASFMAETRSSQSPTAQLKDLVLGGFPVCGVGIGKACATGITNPVFNPDTNMVHTVFDVPITNTGFGTIYDVTIQEDANVFADAVLDKAGSQCSLTKIAGSPVGPTSLLVKGSAPTPVKVADSLAGGATLNVTVECDSSRTQLSNTINVMAKTSAGGGSFNVPPAFHTTSSAEQCGLALQTGVTVSKACRTVSMIGGVVPQVCVDITVTNSSQQDLRVVKLDDVESNGQTVSVLGAFETANNSSNVLQQSGATGDSVTFQRCYTPTANGTDAQNPATVSYPDQATVAGVGVFDGALTGDVQSNTASCPLCPPPPPQ